MAVGTGGVGLILEMDRLRERSGERRSWMAEGQTALMRPVRAL